MITATIHETKTNLSELLRHVRNGETVIITSGRDKEPVAKIEAIKPVKKKRLGARYNPNFELGAAFWEDLPEDELALWNGKGD